MVNVSASGTAGGLEVRAFGSLEALGPLGLKLDALNLASRRPTPFATQAYLRAFLAHDEYADGRQRYQPLILVAVEAGEPIGWLAQRRLHGRWLGLPAERMEFLVTHDNERPRLIARPADEARCAGAFLAWLRERERSWSMLEWMEQDAGSPLAEAAQAAAGLHVRHHPNNPNATIQCAWASGAEYYRSLSRNYRAATRSHVNRLFGQGRVEFVSTWEPSAVNRLLDLHLAVEERSWKAPAAAGICRHPRRIEFFRALFDPAQPMRFSFRFLLLDGLPIASELNGVFLDTWYSFEGAYDESYRDSGPGHLLFLMTMKEALERRAAAVNLLNNYAYVKRRLGATITDTYAVQLFRPWTPLWARARLGELRRRLRPPGPSQAEADHNLEKPPPETSVAQLRAQRPDRTEFARQAAETLEACAPHLERLDGAALLELVGREPAPKAPKAPAPAPARRAGRKPAGRDDAPA